MGLTQLMSLSNRPDLNLEPRVRNMMSEKVIIRKVKRPEAMIRWPAYVVGKDDHGLWLFSPKGTICRGQSRSGRSEVEVGQGNREAGLPVMHLMPDSGWWTASWCRVPKSRISVDVCTPPRLIDGEWTYIDLELDPWAYDGNVEIDDEDEFDDACEAGLILPDEALEARAAATEVVGAMRSNSEPFGTLGWSKLDEAIHRALPPIRELRHVETS